jgi:tetratricopeptide (TPR) repeat protein
VFEDLEHDEAGLPEEGDTGSVSVLPALAEVHRRAGRADEAEQVARRALEFEPGRSDARVVLALALLDQKRPDEARSALEPLGTALLVRHGLDEADVPPAPSGPREPEGDILSDAELDEAFEAAHPERENMIDADAVAQQAIREADRQLLQEMSAPAAVPFATHTVADLLERQGDPEGARRIRAAIDPGADVADRRREAIIAELERWLENLRRPRP